MENCGVWGAREKNKGKLLREIASFCIPHSWHVLRREMEMKVCMHCRRKACCRCISKGDLAVLVLRSTTTAMLSE